MLYSIIFMAIAVLILIFLAPRLKSDPEKYYLGLLLLYFLVSSINLGFVPLGFILCLPFILRRAEVKNRKAKGWAITLGFCCVLLNILVFRLTKP